jgi:hypothetical protein
MGEQLTRRPAAGRMLVVESKILLLGLLADGPGERITDARSRSGLLFLFIGDVA